MGVKSFYIFNAHFLSVNIFQEKGGCEVCANCELFQCFLNGVGINPGRQTVYHMCKTWLKKVHGGWVWGGDFDF